MPLGDWLACKINDPTAQSNNGMYAEKKKLATHDDEATRDDNDIIFELLAPLATNN